MSPACTNDNGSRPDDQAPVQFPECRRSKKNRAAGGQQFLIDFPPLEFAPVITRRQPVDHDRCDAGRGFPAQHAKRDWRSFLPETIAIEQPPAHDAHAELMSEDPVDGSVRHFVEPA